MYHHMYRLHLSLTNVFLMDCEDRPQEYVLYNKEGFLILFTTLKKPTGVLSHVFPLLLDQRFQYNHYENTQAYCSTC